MIDEELWLPTAATAAWRRLSNAIVKIYRPQSTKSRR